MAPVTRKSTPSSFPILTAVELSTYPSEERSCSERMASMRCRSRMVNSLVLKSSVVSMSATASPGAPAPLLSSNSRMAILGFAHADPEKPHRTTKKMQARVHFLNMANTPVSREIFEKTAPLHGNNSIPWPSSFQRFSSKSSGIWLKEKSRLKLTRMVGYSIFSPDHTGRGCDRK
ncbi:hypothetical protein SDC9_54262 [bioreactor metagenome]|uniref:Uncharacterized protein n=1 Tax=bioreactor metagenome TaxID=1076179 RepID=A0A644WWH2_9ZZZZ